MRVTRITSTGEMGRSHAIAAIELRRSMADLADARTRIARTREAAVGASGEVGEGDRCRAPAGLGWRSAQRIGRRADPPGEAVGIAAARRCHVGRIADGDHRADQEQVRAAVRRVAERALLRRSHSGIVVGDLCGMAVGAARDAFVTASDESGRQIVVALLALDAEVRVTTVRRHFGGKVVVTEGALAVHLIRRRCGSAVLRRTVATGDGQRGERCERE